MDALALFCHLHADGAETLERLRDAGHRRLGELPSVPTEELAELLELSVRQVERLLQEARLLAERLHGEGVEDEVMPTAARAEPAARTTGDSDDPADDDPADEDRWDEAPPAPGEAASRSTAAGREPLAGVVLEAWRELDVARPLAQAEHGVLRPTPPPEDREPEAPREASARRPLEPAGELGLDADACARLADVGLTSLEELARGDALALSRAAGLPYTRLARAIFLVRRTLGGEPRPPERAAAKGSETSSGPDEVGGPFA